MSEKTACKPKPDAEDRQHSSDSTGPSAKLVSECRDEKSGQARNLESANATNEMVNKKQLPNVGIVDGNGTNLTPASGGDAARPNGSKEWTIAVDLATTGAGGNGSRLGLGVEPKLDQLKKLAAETKDKSVNFVVSASRLTDANGKPCHADGAGGPAADKCDKAAWDAHRVKTERYFIHDGKIDQLPDSKAKTQDQELKSLLKDAQKISPSEKLGLVIQSTGTGTDGLITNKGTVPLDNAVKGIKDGLAGGEHKKLDMLDFDACSMGDVGVLNKTKDIANNIVASSGIEKVSPSSDGQNLGAALHSLLDNPHMSGKEFAAKIVGLAKDNANGAGSKNGTPTLASFDTTQFNNFKDNLDKFGAQLKHSMHDGPTKDLIRKAVDDAPVAPDGRSVEKSHYRDIRSFAQNLVNSLGDKDPKLAGAAKSLIQSFDKMTPAQYGDPTQGQGGIGGLSVNLPGKEIADKKEVGKVYSPLHQLGSTLTEAAEIKMQFKPDLVRDISRKLTEIEMSAPGSKADLNELHKGVDKIRNAKTEQDLQAAVKDFGRTVAGEEGTAFGATLAKSAETSFPSAWREHKNHKLPTITPNWDSFVKAEDKPR